MRIVINSKFFSHLSIEQLGEKIVQLDYDGVDICLREGHPINAANAVDVLPKAVRIWQNQGLVCPIATAPVTMTNPDTDEAETLYAACGDAGIPLLRIGFWKFNEGDNYWKSIDVARTSLEGFVKLSEKYKVQTCYQMHSGPVLGSNCAGLAHLIKGLPPKHIGVCLDFGHLVLDGEDCDMALAMIHDYLSAVFIKDALYSPQPEGQNPPYIPRFVKVGDGCVDWLRCFRALRKVGFEGILSVHTEYSFEESIVRQVGYSDTSPPNLEQWAKEDVDYLRLILSKLDYE